MGRPLPPSDAELYRRVSDVLLHEWDPLGVSEDPDAADEYHGYLPEVYRRVQAGASPDALADALLRVERQSMSLWLPGERLLTVAARLHGLRR